MDCVTMEAAAVASIGPQNVWIPYFEFMWQDSPKRKETPVTDMAAARNTTGIDHPAIWAPRKNFVPGTTCQQI
jgi:hypothetical protein